MTGRYFFYKTIDKTKIIVYTKCILSVLKNIIRLERRNKMFDIDLQNRTPIYEQLYKKTVELIIKNVLKENDQLPSVRSLAKELGINPNTVAKAYQELERNKIIYSISGRGSFVAKTYESSVKDYILADFDEKASEALKIGISKSELTERIERL